jgi:leucyl-tRNA synthetase
MLAPFAPHTAEELWERTGHADGLAAVRWPVYDSSVARAEEIVVPVQVNGKVRARLTVSVEATEEELRGLALADPAVMGHTAGKTVRKVVVARGKLVSVVVQ